MLNMKKKLLLLFFLRLKAIVKPIFAIEYIFSLNILSLSKSCNNTMKKDFAFVENMTKKMHFIINSISYIKERKFNCSLSF